MIIVMYKLAVTPNASIMDLGAFFCALGGYNYKKYINKDSINQAAKVVNTVTEAADKLTNKEKDNE